MRIIGPALVVLALACSPHGVRLHEEEAATGQGSAEAPVLCQEPLLTPGPDPETLQLPPLPEGAKFIPLNTTGYNYTFQERYPVPPPPSVPVEPKR